MHQCCDQLAIQNKKHRVLYAENIIGKRIIIIANDIKVFRKYILCDAIYEF